VGRVVVSSLNVVPEAVASAAQDVAGIGSALTQAHAEAAPATTAILTAAQDEVSASIAALFSEHGQAFQSLSAQATRFHEQFAQTLSKAGGAYLATEAASANLFFRSSAVGVASSRSPYAAVLFGLVNDASIGARPLIYYYDSFATLGLDSELFTAYYLLATATDPEALVADVETLDETLVQDLHTVLKALAQNVRG